MFSIGAGVDKLSVYFYTDLPGIAEKAKRAVPEKKKTALNERDPGRIIVAPLSIAFQFGRLSII